MTTQIALSGLALLKESEKNFPTLNTISVWRSDGENKLIHKNLAGSQANTEKCKIYSFEVTPSLKSDTASFSEFDKLVESLEHDTAEANQLSEGRKWVADTFYKDAAPTLASLRLAAGLSQRQIAESCGIEQPHVSRYESGKHEPSITIAAKMAKAMNINLDLFLEAWGNSRHISQSETSHD